MATTPDQVEVKVRFEAELSVIRPGDKVLVRMPRDTRPEQALHVAKRLRERLPDVEVLVLAGVDGIEVYRPGEHDHVLVKAERRWGYECTVPGCDHFQHIDTFDDVQDLVTEAGGPDGGERASAEGPGEAAAP